MYGNGILLETFFDKPHVVLSKKYAKAPEIRCASSIIFSLCQRVAELGQIDETMSIDISYIGRFGSINKTMDNKFHYIVGKKGHLSTTFGNPIRTCLPGNSSRRSAIPHTRCLRKPEDRRQRNSNIAIQ